MIEGESLDATSGKLEAAKVREEKLKQLSAPEYKDELIALYLSVYASYIGTYERALEGDWWEDAGVGGLISLMSDKGKSSPYVLISPIFSPTLQFLPSLA